MVWNAEIIFYDTFVIFCRHVHTDTTHAISQTITIVSYKPWGGSMGQGVMPPLPTSEMYI